MRELRRHWPSSQLRCWNVIRTGILPTRPAGSDEVPANRATKRFHPRDFGGYIPAASPAAPRGDPSMSHLIVRTTIFEVVGAFLDPWSSSSEHEVIEATVPLS